MRSLYSLLLYLLTPFILLRLYWKGRFLPAYRSRIAERFALGKPIEKADVWLHAVSMGEVVAAAPLIEGILAKSWSLLITTMTPTGSEQVVKRYGNRVQHQYMPYDYPSAIRRFLNQLQPKLIVIMETELWPNLVHIANQRKIPLLLANARISDKAFKQYEKLAFIMPAMLKNFSAIFAQSELDRKRFTALGAPKELTKLAGNIKFDLQYTVPKPEVFNSLKELWGKNRPVFIAASTHDNEEEQLLGQFRNLQKAIPDIILLIAPRHPERFQKVYELAKQLGYRTGLRSLRDSVNPENEVIVLDSMGELLGFYQVADYAFVGGSLVPIGGHNVLEAIAMQTPVFTGPYMNNSKSIVEELTDKKAMQMVNTAEGLIQSLILLHQDKKASLLQMQAAEAVLQANRGSLDYHMQFINHSLMHQRV